jgi:hypothetical protein
MLVVAELIGFFLAFVNKFFQFQRCESKSTIGHFIYDFLDSTFISDTVDAVFKVLKFCSLRRGRHICIVCFR